jgi:hypothetical protein
VIKLSEMTRGVHGLPLGAGPEGTVNKVRAVQRLMAEGFDAKEDPGR